MYLPIWLLLVLVVAAFFFLKSKKKENGFAPFRVWIIPNWDELLRDYQLLEQFKNSQEKYNAEQEKKVHEYDIMRDGVSFTILESDERHELVYNDNHKTFHTEVDIDEPIKNIVFPSTFRGYSPDFRIKAGLEGYEIGITTPESFKKVVMVGDDNDFIKVTIIPYSVFGLPRFRFGVAKPEQVTERLEKNGWVEEEISGEEGLMGRPLEIRHKYFTLYYRYI